MLMKIMNFDRFEWILVEIMKNDDFEWILSDFIFRGGFH
jgi:hypothetical protein